jgi:cytochrome c-type biogenesis protein CcmE
LPVSFSGSLPDLFREGQGVVAEGALDAAGTFKADTVLAKHDETYMPKDVADALKKQGHWKDDYGKQGAKIEPSRREPRIVTRLLSEMGGCLLLSAFLPSPLPGHFALLRPT